MFVEVFILLLLVPSTDCGFMIIGEDPVLGYLVDEIWLRNLAKKFGYIGDPNPAYLALYQEECHSELMQYHEFEATMALGRRTTEKVKIRGLRILPVYISNCHSCMCWSLPFSMHPEGRSAKKTARLEFFKTVICEEDEPTWWASTDGDVPRAMRHMSEPREDHWRLTLQSLPGWDEESGDLLRVEDVPIIRDEDGMMIEPPPFLKKRAERASESDSETVCESDVETLRPSSPDASEIGDCDVENRGAETDSVEHSDVH